MGELAAKPPGQHVLVVDDDVDYREVVSSTLQRAGLSVATAGSADEAFTECSRQRPALILMDVRMPGKSGIQALSLFRSAPLTADLPVILMSGHWADQQQVERALQAGAADVMSKEQRDLELLARVRSALAMAALRVRLAGIEQELGSLKDVLAVCAGCKQVRNESGAWESVETWLRRLSGLELTHGICPGCRERLYAGEPADDSA